MTSRHPTFSKEWSSQVVRDVRTAREWITEWSEDYRPGGPHCQTPEIVAMQREERRLRDIANLVDPSITTNIDEAEQAAESVDFISPDAPGTPPTSRGENFRSAALEVAIELAIQAARNMTCKDDEYVVRQRFEKLSAELEVKTWEAVDKRIQEDRLKANDQQRVDPGEGPRLRAPTSDGFSPGRSFIAD